MLGNFPDRADVLGIMHQFQLVDSRVAPFPVVDGVEQSGIVAKSACNRSKAPDVLRMPPPRVVSPAIAVGNERSPHGSGRATKPLTLPLAGGGR